MILLCAYLVTLLIAPQLWLPPFVGLPTDVLLYPCWFLYALLSGRLVRVGFGAPEWLLLAFIAAVGLSILVNGTTWNFIDIVLLKYVKWFVLYLLVKASIRDVADLRRAAAFMVLLVYVLVAEGIDHKLSANGLNWAGQPLGWVDPAVLAEGGNGRTRWVGVFDGIGVFCVAYTLALPFTLQYVSSRFGAWTRCVNLMALPLLLLAIYYTSSRGGLLATMALISLHIALKAKVSVKALVTCSLLLGVVFSLAPAHLTATRDSSKSAQHRVEVWASGLTMLSNNPALGVGRGNFINHTRTIIAHNSGVEIMAETGLVGIFLWVSVILACLRAAYARYAVASTPADRDTVLALMLAVVGYLVSGLFVTLEYETFYMLLAMCAAIRPRDSSVYGTTQVRQACAAIAVFIVTIKALVMLY